MLVRISPDGGEVVHLHNDKYNQITSKHSTMKIERASDVFFDNEIQRWRVKIRHTNAILAIDFATRQEALDHEHALLENDLRCRFI
mgnify:FL=1